MSPLVLDRGVEGRRRKFRRHRSAAPFIDSSETLNVEAGTFPLTLLPVNVTGRVDRRPLRQQIVGTALWETCCTIQVHGGGSSFFVTTAATATKRIVVSHRCLPRHHHDREQTMNRRSDSMGHLLLLRRSAPSAVDVPRRNVELLVRVPPPPPLLV
jgi:hypothetical protein